MLNRPRTEEEKRKISESCKKRGIGKWMKDKKFLEITKKKMSQSKKGIRPKNNLTWIGENHPKWKGDNVGEVALHAWVKRQLGFPNKCEFCEKIVIKPTGIHWANKSGQYLRNINDWLRLCAKCHVNYDRSKEMGNLARRFGYD